MLPDFQVTLADTDETKSIFELIGDKPLALLDFYTNWCKTCPQVAKKIDEIASKYPENTYVLINLENDVEGAQEFYKQHGLKNVISAVVDDDLLGAFGIKGIPHKTIIRANVVTHNGADVDLDSIDFAATIATPSTSATDSTDKGYQGSRISKEWKSWEKK